jgi:citrate lyase subunit gamma (acyl carrier protein)
MSKVRKPAQAGTVESTDILIMLAPAEPGSGIQIELISPTMQQYGEHIKALITRALVSYGIEDAVVHANEKGALDYTIEARVKTAVMRALG